MRPRQRDRIEWVTEASATTFGTLSHAIASIQVTVEHPDGGDVRIMPGLLRRAVANGAAEPRWDRYLAKERADDSERDAETP